MMSRARPAKEQRAAKPLREALDVVLIVCEGELTEPNYFKQLCGKLRLSTANVEVVGRECGSDPNSVVDYAVNLFKMNRDYDRVYCVFDRDTHPSYDAARERCRGLRQKNLRSKVCEFTAVTSNPCFEYWIYLHFQDSDAPVRVEGRRSPGAVMLSRLLAEMPQYEKSSESLFDVLLPKLENAVVRARRVNGRDLENPHTKVVDLVVELISMRNDWNENWIRGLVTKKT